MIAYTLNASVSKWNCTGLRKSMNVKLKGQVTFFIILTIVTVEIAMSFNSVLLPNLKAEMALSEQMAQWSLGIGLLALGFSGILYGAVSENLGRRPIILSGLSLFCIGTLVTALSSNVIFLLVGRFIQGFGAGVGWIVGNASLKDIYDNNRYAKAMNTVHSAAGAVPIIAPVVGSYIANFFGWRATFGVLVVGTALILVLKILKLPETNFHREPITFATAVGSYKSLFFNGKYLKLLSVKALSVMLLFTESANIPLIFIGNLKVDPKLYGFYMLPVSISYVISSYISGLLVGRFCLKKLISTGLVLILASNISVLLLMRFYELDALLIQLLKVFTYAGWGMIFGNATAELISAVPKNPGAASAVMISLEMIFLACGIYILSLFYDGTLFPLSLFMIFISLLCLLIIRLPPHS